MFCAHCFCVFLFSGSARGHDFREQIYAIHHGGETLFLSHAFWSCEFFCFVFCAQNIALSVFVIVVCFFIQNINEENK